MYPILNWLVYYSTQFSVCLRPEAPRLAAHELVQQAASSSFHHGAQVQDVPGDRFSGNTLITLARIFEQAPAKLASGLFPGGPCPLGKFWGYLPDLI